MRTVKLPSGQIKEEVNYGVKKRREPFSDVRMRKGELWRKCMDLISNPDLMNKIIFCNDVLKIPPVKVFLALPVTQKAVENLDLQGKRFLGAFFEYIFKFVFEYQEKHTKRINSNIIEIATYYSGKKYNIVVVD